MAKFKYTGPEMMVGRFGRLKPGAIVDLWQSEAEFVLSRNQTDWEDVSETDTSGIGTVLPMRVPPYDLTRIDWLRECRGTLKRMSRGELGEVAKAMRLVGCSLPSEPECRNFSREHLFEVVYGEARRLQWDQPNYQVSPDRHAPVSHTEVVVIPDEPAVEPTEEAKTFTEEVEEKLQEIAKPSKKIKRRKD